LGKSTEPKCYGIRKLSKPTEETCYSILKFSHKPYIGQILQLKKSTWGKGENSEEDYKQTEKKVP